MYNIKVVNAILESAMIASGRPSSNHFNTRACKLIAHNSGKQSAAQLSEAVERILAIDVNVETGMHKVSLSVFAACEKKVVTTGLGSLARYTTESLKRDQHRNADGFVIMLCFCPGSHRRFCPTLVCAVHGFLVVSKQSLLADLIKSKVPVLDKFWIWPQLCPGTCFKSLGPHRLMCMRAAG